MRIIHFFIVGLLCTLMLAGCESSEPVGRYSKLVYSIALPTERGKIDTWSELKLKRGVLVQADNAVFWVDADNRLFALNPEGVRIADPQSGTARATSELLEIVNQDLIAAGQRSIYTRGGWKNFQWNNRQ